VQRGDRQSSETRTELERARALQGRIYPREGRSVIPSVDSRNSRVGSWITGRGLRPPYQVRAGWSGMTSCHDCPAQIEDFVSA
jgi:hypothetical protein